jgi:hypothetical protein
MDAQARYEELLEDLAHRHPHVQAGKMFGMPVFKTNGKVAGGLWQTGMVFKLTDPAARERALAIEGATLFDPMGNRPLKEWVVVPSEHAERWDGLADDALAGL